MNCKNSFFVLNHSGLKFTTVSFVLSCHDTFIHSSILTLSFVPTRSLTGPVGGSVRSHTVSSSLFTMRSENSSCAETPEVSSHTTIYIYLFSGRVVSVNWEAVIYFKGETEEA